MPRIDSENPTPREIYDQMCADWSELSDLFRNKLTSTPPYLALLLYKGKSYDECYVRFQPQGIPLGIRREIRDRMLEDPQYNNLHLREPGRFEFIILQGTHYYSDDFDRTEVHEVTHSVTSPDSGVSRIKEVGTDQLIEIRDSEVDIVHPRPNLSKIVQGLGLTSIELELEEFYPPIGLSHMFRGDIHRIGYLLMFTVRPLEDPNRPLEDRISRAKHLGYNLTVIAGERLEGLYRGDIRALIREHPRLAYLSAEELWSLYCWPLLTKTFQL